MQANTHLLSFRGPERRSAAHISSDNFHGFPHHLSCTVSPFPLPPRRLPRSHCSSVSSLAWFSLCRLPFRQKGVCQVPNPLAKRSKADKATGDLLFYSRKAKKKWNPPRPGLCILPPFLPELLFHSFNPALVFFLFCQTLSPPRPRCL